MKTGKNGNLHKAKKVKNDEFFTRLEDIESELAHYREHFRDKVVYMNCDDHEISNFWKYFVREFDSLGLKKIIATHYEPDENRQSFMTVLDRERLQDGKYSSEEQMRKFQEEPEHIPIEGNGDFRSPACIELLKEADIVVTNPAFSLFREYVAQLMEHGKKFLIIGPINAITYKEIFPLIKENQLWLGYGFHGGNAYFRIPPEKASEYKESVYNPQTGLVKFRNCHWYTNLDHAKRHEPLVLIGNSYWEKPGKYPKYDNYDAINCDKVADIPDDYYEAIGVPITWLSHACVDQFSIIGISANGLIDKTFKLPHFKKHNEPFLNGKRKYQRIFIRRIDGKSNKNITESRN